jgi:spore coat polysaccharide biosynthesis predicted glycosyltransferase SpsG
MTLKGTTDIGTRHVSRICSLAKELDKIGAYYEITVYARNMTEYDRCKKEWAAFEEKNTNQSVCLCYKNVTIHKPGGEI